MISTVDVQTRHTRKSKSVRRDGYRGHVAAEPETGLITDAEMTQAAGQAGSDPVVGQAMISRDRYHRAEAGACPPSADEEKVSAEPVAESDAAPTGAHGETATADAADHPQPDAADEQQGRGLQV